MIAGVIIGFFAGSLITLAVVIWIIHSFAIGTEFQGYEGESK